jgi:hypothetical protein
LIFYGLPIVNKIDDTRPLELGFTEDFADLAMLNSNKYGVSLLVVDLNVCGSVKRLEPPLQ